MDMSKIQSRITPFLWFNDNAEQAVEFYLSVFPNSRRTGELRNPGEAPGPKGGIMTIAFELDGLKFIALNGGPHFKFNEAVSFLIGCETQEEIDYYWEKLTAGGQEIQCGWLKDKFGLAWQVAPTNFADLVRHPAAMKAMMGMKKFDIAALKRAGKES
jgi:predicted 3-demethylubiquinone-9 3-methyltransferase (glyoxalase superfamily)